MFQFHHTCTILRKSVSETSASNLPVETFANHITGQICRYNEKRVDSRLWNAEALDSVRGSATIILPGGVDVTERDRITSIAVSPTETLTDVFEIVGLSIGRNHVGAEISIRLVVKRIS